MGADSGYQAFIDGAAIVLREDVSTLELSGPDAVRFLNGMVSNDVAHLEPGHGVLAVKTSNRGRVEGLIRVRRTETALLIDLSKAVALTVCSNLEKFIIMDDCAIRDVSDTREVVSFYGPKAAGVLAALCPRVPSAEHAFLACALVDVPTASPAVVIRDTTMGLEGFEIHVPRGTRDEVLQAALRLGATLASPEALDIHRVERGVPVDGRDLDEDVIPMEARLERAISTTKGCYIGQEVIARATNLGGVKHILVGLRLSELVGEGAALFNAPDQKIGEITSQVLSPRHGIIALGYVHRSSEALGTRLTARLGEAGPSIQAEICALPFR